MEFEIVEAIEIGDSKVEVRARLADGRLAIVALPLGSDLNAGVAAYLMASATAAADTAVAMKEAAENA